MLSSVILFIHPFFPSVHLSSCILCPPVDRMDRGDIRTYTPKKVSPRFMAILKANKNNQKVFVRYFVLFVRWRAWNIDPNCPSYIQPNCLTLCHTHSQPPFPWDNSQRRIPNSFLPGLNSIITSVSTEHNFLCS